MRIIHIVRNIEYIGGTEKFLISLLKNWQKKFEEDKIYLICLEGVGPAAKKAALKYNFKLIDFSIVWWNPFDIFRLAKKLKSLKPDIVHTHLFQADFPGILASRIAGLRVVSTKYCQFSRAIEKNTKFEKYFVKPVSDKYLEYLLSFLSNKTITVSEKSFDYFLNRGYKKKDLSVIPCCHLKTDDKLFGIPTWKKYNKNREIKLGTVSRLVPEKGIDNLLDIFSKLYIKYQNTELYIAGDGFLKEKLREKTRLLGIEKKVHFLGHVDDISGFLKKIDIFVFTSHSEGFPLAIQEAMAAGRPIVSTSVGGINTLIKNKKSGILFEDGDNGDGVKSLEYLIENPKYAREIALKARETMKNVYNLDQAMEAIRTVYSSLF